MFALSCFSSSCVWICLIDVLLLSGFNCVDWCVHGPWETLRFVLLCCHLLVMWSMCREAENGDIINVLKAKKNWFQMKATKLNHILSPVVVKDLFLV